MICISINQESRRMALADVVNAKHFGDVLEIRLDRFGKSPEIGELLAKKAKPVIMVCRRGQDGGFWEGTEQDRLAILRQCIISKADYVEIELDVADDIRSLPPCKRVISYTNMTETPEDILDIYDEMLTKKPDVIKLVTLAQTLDEAWPLTRILAKAVVPTVVVGLGKPAIMLALLGKKYGAPWTYAALERGLEAYPGQPNIRDLESIYHLQHIERKTRFIGVTGFEERDLITVAALNAIFAFMKLSFRCLPMGVGDMKTFRKIMETAQLAGAVISAEHQEAIVEMEPELHGIARQTQAADVIFRSNEAWHGFHSICHAWIGALSEALRKRYPVGNPFQDRFVLIVGLNIATKVIAKEVREKGGNAIIASHEKKAGQAIAKAIGCRYIPYEAIYATQHDVLVVCDEERTEHTGGIHANYLKPGMIAMDLNAGARNSDLLREAAQCGAVIVSPLELLVQTLELQAKILAGKSVPREVILEAIPARFLDEVEEKVAEE